MSRSSASAYYHVGFFHPRRLESFSSGHRMLWRRVVANRRSESTKVPRNMGTPMSQKLGFHRYSTGRFGNFDSSAVLQSATTFRVKKSAPVTNGVPTTRHFQARAVVTLRRAALLCHSSHRLFRIGKGLQVYVDHQRQRWRHADPYPFSPNRQGSARFLPPIPAKV